MEAWTVGVTRPPWTVGVHGSRWLRVLRVGCGRARREGVDDKRHVGEPGPGGHVGEIGDPQAIRGRGSEVAVDQIGRALVAGGRDGGAPLGAADDPTDAQLTHEPGDVVAADLEAFPAEL